MIRKSVLIIGATGGIGESLVSVFAQNNYDIVATFLNGSTKKIEGICENAGVKITTIKMDLKDKSSIYQGIERAFQEDYLDCAVCCAGISKDEVLLSDEFDENIDELIDIDFKGIIYCNKYLAKLYLKQKHGNIINISSVYGEYGGACESVYSACKAGIIGLTRALALELAPQKIRVNAIAPGFIETKMTERFEDEKDEIRDKVPLKRLGCGEDVANTALFLASEGASYITGEVIDVSGGVLRF